MIGVIKMDTLFQLYILNGFALLTAFCLDVFFIRKKRNFPFKKVMIIISIRIDELINKLSRPIQALIVQISFFLIFIIISIITYFFFEKMIHYNKYFLFIIVTLFYFNAMQLSYFELQIRKSIKAMHQNDEKEYFKVLKDFSVLKENQDFKKMKRNSIATIAEFCLDSVVKTMLFAFIGGPVLVLFSAMIDALCQRYLDSNKNTVLIETAYKIKLTLLFVPFYVSVALSLIAFQSLKMHVNYAFQTIKRNLKIGCFNYYENLNFLFLAGMELPFDCVGLECEQTFNEDSREVIKALQITKLVAYLGFILISLYYLFIIKF